jgi:hypothetical protein
MRRGGGVAAAQVARVPPVPSGVRHARARGQLRVPADRNRYLHRAPKNGGGADRLAGWHTDTVA